MELDTLFFYSQIASLVMSSAILIILQKTTAVFP